MNSSPTNASGGVAARHWPEYLMDGALLGLFMLSACAFGMLLDHPRSAVHHWMASPHLRRALGGLAMGATAVALIYSPWGKQSGAHFNPAVTLNYWRMGRMRGIDAVGYFAGQFAGGVLGVILARSLIGSALGDPGVNFLATVPGTHGAVGAFLGEFAISLIHITLILFISNHPRLAPYTGWFAGLLVASWITFEAPLSGMSMNPARTFASALPGNIWTGWWIYFTAPLLGMLSGGFLFGWFHGRQPMGCPKLVHSTRVRCIFCGHLMSRLSALTAPAAMPSIDQTSTRTLR
jgi:aquaporin Z